MADKPGISVGGEKRWPLSLDTHDPEQVASFTLGLGYAEADVVNTLVTRCNLDLLTAKRIVSETARNQQGGQP